MLGGQFLGALGARPGYLSVAIGDLIVRLSVSAPPPVPRPNETLEVRGLKAASVQPHRKINRPVRIAAQMVLLGVIATCTLFGLLMRTIECRTGHI